MVGCGAENRGSSDVGVPAGLVSTGNYVASPTVGPAKSAPLFRIPGLGRFTAVCNSSATTWLDPGDGLTVGPRGGRKDFQIALLSEGNIKVATASFAAARMKGSSFCFVTAKADVSARRR